MLWELGDKMATGSITLSHAFDIFFVSVKCPQSFSNQHSHMITLTLYLSTITFISCAPWHRFRSPCYSRHALVFAFTCHTQSSLCNSKLYNGPTHQVSSRLTHVTHSGCYACVGDEKHAIYRVLLFLLYPGSRFFHRRRRRFINYGK